jgi:hypothetical protein
MAIFNFNKALEVLGRHREGTSDVRDELATQLEAAINVMRQRRNKSAEVHDSLGGDKFPRRVIAKRVDVPLDENTQLLVECPCHRNDNMKGDGLFMLRAVDDSSSECPACRSEGWSDFYERAVNRIWSLLADPEDMPERASELCARARVAGEIADKTLAYVGAGLPLDTPTKIFDADRAVAAALAVVLKDVAKAAAKTSGPAMMVTCMSSEVVVEELVPFQDEREDGEASTDAASADEDSVE